MKFTVHPLFFAVGIVSAFFGALPSFILCTLTALLHECGHLFCAHRMGFTCKSVQIMPYGAAATIAVDGIAPWDEIKLALAGPFVNAALCVALGGLWWFFPETYAYTDTILFAGVAMLAINLLPCTPLDGGRVAECLLSLVLSRKTAHTVCRVLSLICAGICAVCGVLWANISLVLVGVFLLCSFFERPIALIPVTYRHKLLARGVPVKTVLVDRTTTYQRALSLVDGRHYLLLQCYDDGIADELTEDELLSRATAYNLFTPVFAVQKNIAEENSSAKDSMGKNPLVLCDTSQIEVGTRLHMIGDDE